MFFTSVTIGSDGAVPMIFPLLFTSGSSSDSSSSPKSKSDD